MSWMARLLTRLVRAYQVAFSPYIGPQCRFHPTCSHYALEALRRHGAWSGSILTIRRLGKCHPWHAGGHDPVP